MRPKTKRQLFPCPEVTFSEYLASDILGRCDPSEIEGIQAAIGPQCFTNQHRKSSIKRGSALWATTGRANTRTGDTDPVKALHSACFLLSPFLVLPSFLLSASEMACGQMHPVSTATPLPETPLPIIKHENSKNGPCRVIPKSESAGIALTETGSGYIATLAGFPPVELPAIPATGVKPNETTPPNELPPCPPMQIVNFYQRFMNGPEVKPLTPREKAHLAVRNVLDPFNAVTILGNAAIDRRVTTPILRYGPGMHGFAKAGRRQLHRRHDGRVRRHFPHPLHRSPGSALPSHAPTPPSSAASCMPSCRSAGHKATTARACQTTPTFSASPSMPRSPTSTSPGIQTDLPATASSLRHRLGARPHRQLHYRVPARHCPAHPRSRRPCPARSSTRSPEPNPRKAHSKVNQPGKPL